jgi:hypothetical protein
VAFEDEETGEMLPPRGPEPPKQPSAAAVEGLWQDVLPENQAPAGPAPPATVHPGAFEAFGPNTPPEPTPQAQQGGPVSVLKDILKACEGIEEATAKNAEELRSLKDALDGLGTFGP